MTVYAFAQAGGFSRIKITKHEDRAGAEGWLEETSNDFSGMVFERPEEIDLPKHALMSLYRGVSGNPPSFKTRAEGQQAVYDAIVADLQSDDFTTHKGDYIMAEKAKEAKPAKAEKKPEAKEYPAGKVAEFKQVRAGSIRAKLLALGNGKRTLDDVAKELDSSRSNLRVTLNCLQRDCGIGFKIDEKEHLTFLYPGSKTMADAIVTVKPEPPKKAAKGKEQASAAAA